MASSDSGSDTPCLKRRKGVVNADQYARNKYWDNNISKKPRNKNVVYNLLHMVVELLFVKGHFWNHEEKVWAVVKPTSQSGDSS